MMQGSRAAVAVRPESGPAQEQLFLGESAAHGCYILAVLPLAYV